MRTRSILPESRVNKYKAFFLSKRYLKFSKGIFTPKCTNIWKYNFCHPALGVVEKLVKTSYDMVSLLQDLYTVEQDSVTRNCPGTSRRVVADKISVSHDAPGLQ